ncbi:MAG TPA: ABC transporter permease, partial [bacterium]|nr:ABC transporter permease [bacterium]
MNMIAELGRFFISLAGKLGRAGLFLKDSFYWLLKGKWEKEEIMKQMVRVGVQSLPVVTLTSLFTGMVLALQSGLSSKNIFNEPLYVGTLVSLSMVLELGPVLTSIVVAGRVGASIAAEIGTMRVTEQIDALYMLGVHPISYLSVPRFLACIFMVPVLVIYADSLGILGGLFVCLTKLGIPARVYWDDILPYLDMIEVMHGVVKSFFFGAIIFWVSCYNGFFTKGGAEGVGRSTTMTVVVSMVLILLSDYFLGSFLISIGI